MSVTCGFYNSLNHDRKYDATQMSSIFDGIIRDGIFMSIGTHLSVTAGEGMFVTVGEGKAWFNHTWTLNDAELPLAIEVAELVLDRIDAVVLEVDSSESIRNNTIKVIKGTPSSEPERPAMEDTETLHQYPLAYISVKANATQITTSDITNMIGTEDTPFITGILETIDITSLVAQWESQWDDQIDANQKEYDTWLLQQQTSFLTWREDEENTFEAWRIENQSEFEEWFQNLKNQLDENQATNLQNQIDDIKDELKVTGGSRVVVTIDDKKGTIKVAGLPVTLRIDGAEYASVVEENKTATFAGILEIGVAEIECNDSTQDLSTGCTLEIPCYSYYETTTVKVDMYEQWLLTAGYTLDDYPEVSDIVKDYEAMYRMMNLHATVDYWVRWYNANNTILSHFTTSEVAMKAIGENDYAADSLMAIPAVNDALLASTYWEYILNAKVPVMTGYTAPEGEFIAGTGSYPGSFDVWRAFDGDETTSYASNTSTTDGGKWFVYHFTKPTRINRITGKSFVVTAVTNRDGKYKLSGSNDNNVYEDIGEFVYTESNLSIDEYIINDKYYKYYKVTTITDNKIQDGKYYSQFTTLQFYGRQMNALVPTMTSNTEPSGEASASSEYSYHLAYRAFDSDKTLNSYWNANSNVNEWLKYKFQNPKVVKSFSIIPYIYDANDSGRVKNFKIQASNDGSEFVDLYTGIIEKETALFVCDIENNEAYQYYRLYVIDNYVTFDICINDLQFYGPSYEETVGLAVPGGFKNWLEAGGYSESQYENVEALLEDEKAVRNLMTKTDAVDCLVDWLKKDNDAAKTILEDSYVAKWINYREYAYSSLCAVESLKAIMDETGKYGMYITVEKPSKIKALVPVMTSNTTPKGEAFASSYHDNDYLPFKAFNGTNDHNQDCWLSKISEGLPTPEKPQYIGYKSNSGLFIVNKVKVTNRDLTNDALTNSQHPPKDVIVQGSNDGSKWDDLATYTNTVTDQKVSWEIPVESKTGYMYHRLLIQSAHATSTANKYVSIGELQFYGTQLEALIPPMTSNTTPSGEASAKGLVTSSLKNTVITQPYTIFAGVSDSSSSRTYFNLDENVTDRYVQYKFNEPKIVNCVYLENNMDGSNYYVSSFKIQASDDGINFKDISATITHSGGNGLGQYHSLENDTAYIAYRLIPLTHVNNHSASSRKSEMNVGAKLQFYGVKQDWQPKGLVPVMTSNTAPYGEVISNGEYSGYYAYKVFDGNNTGADDSWLASLTEPTVTSPHYIGYKSTSPIILNKVKVANRNVYDDIHEGSQHPPKDVIVQGSNDGSKWDDLANHTNNITESSAIWEIDISSNTKAYIYHRLLITSRHNTGWKDAYVSIGQLQFYGRQLEALIPPMTSNTSPMGEVTYSSIYSSEYDGWKAFDGTITSTTSYSNSTSGYAPHGSDNFGSAYVQYEFEKPVIAKAVGGYYRNSTNVTFTYKLQASNDGVDFTTIADAIEMKSNAIGFAYYSTNADKAYKYYRFVYMSNSDKDITRGGGAKFQLYGSPDYESRTYIYDHGVEVMEVDIASGSSTNVLEKRPDELYANCVATTNSDTRGGFITSELVNLSDYNVVRIGVGKEGLNLIDVTLAVTKTPLIYATAISRVTESCLPNMICLDITSISESLYIEFRSDSKADKFAIAEWWLE